RAHGPIPGMVARGEWAPRIRGCRGRARLGAGHCGSPRSPDACLEPVPPASRLRRSASGLHARRAAALGARGVARLRRCARAGRRLSRREMDIAVRDSVEAALDQIAPWAVINAAGYVRVDDAETDRERCERENVVGPRVLAGACRVRKLPLVTFSSDLVFDGR